MFAAFADPHLNSRPRVKRTSGPKPEALESRRMLDASMGSVFPNLGYAVGLPVASLETGSDLPVSSSGSFSFSGLPTFGSPGTASLFGQDAQLLPGQPSVSLPVLGSAFPGQNFAVAPTFAAGPSATGPALTLNGLGSSSETAAAAASTVTRATPGADDRVFSGTPQKPMQIVPLPHLRGPNREPFAGRGGALPIDPPSFRPDRPKVEPAPATPQPAPAVPDAVKSVAPEPAHPVEIAPPTTPDDIPTRPEPPVSFQPWDAALDLVELDLAADSSAYAAIRAEESMAVGALMAAWGGLNVALRTEGYSRRRPLTPATSPLEAGPDDAGR